MQGTNFVFGAREATTVGKFEGGELVQAILTKVVFARERLWW